MNLLFFPSVTDIDECAESGSSICSGENERCENTYGSHYCDCVDGYRRSGDECLPYGMLNMHFFSVFRQLLCFSYLLILFHAPIHSKELYLRPKKQATP